jgi:hypothetical protein
VRPANGTNSVNHALNREGARLRSIWHGAGDRAWRGRGAVGHVAGDVGEPTIVVAGVDALRGEGVLHVEPFPFSDHSRGLRDDDAGVEGVVELRVEDLGLEGGTLLENGDGGNVGECLARRARTSCQRAGNRRHGAAFRQARR